jgi:hypothetical protein
MIASILAAPTVMTLNARKARALTASCQTSHNNNPNTSTHCM